MCMKKSIPTPHWQPLFTAGYVCIPPGYVLCIRETHIHIEISFFFTTKMRIISDVWTVCFFHLQYLTDSYLSKSVHLETTTCYIFQQLQGIPCIKMFHNVLNLIIKKQNSLLENSFTHGSILYLGILFLEVGLQGQKVCIYITVLIDSPQMSSSQCYQFIVLSTRYEYIHLLTFFFLLIPHDINL